MADWLNRIASTIYREYDRRIRRASLITEYGAHHHDDHAGHDDHSAESADEHDDAEIVNVPRGTAVQPEEHAEPVATKS